MTNFTKLVGPDRPTEVVLVTNVFSFTDLVQVPHTTLVTNEWPAVTWEERSFLDVVDFADAVNPVVRPPVNIPGALRGVSHEGAVLYTVGNHWDPVTHTTDGREWLDATAYDGVEAHWIASLALPVAWPHPLVITGPNIFLGKPVDSANGIPTPTGALESWTLTDTGAFASLGTLAFPTPLQNLVARGPLLGAQFGSEVRLLDASAPATLRVVGSSSPTSCLWYNLDDADGSLDQGLWLPLGEYGAGHLGLDPAP